jgi:hypothetical protein
MDSIAKKLQIEEKPLNQSVSHPAMKIMEKQVEQTHMSK